MEREEWKLADSEVTDLLLEFGCRVLCPPIGRLKLAVALTGLQTWRRHSFLRALLGCQLKAMAMPGGRPFGRRQVGQISLEISLPDHFQRI